MPGRGSPHRQNLSSLFCHLVPPYVPPSFPPAMGNENMALTCTDWLVSHVPHFSSRRYVCVRVRAGGGEIRAEALRTTTTQATLASHPSPKTSSAGPCHWMPDPHTFL